MTIRGRVDDGATPSPLSNAVCHFVPQGGDPSTSTTADLGGVFRLDVPPQIEGLIECSPQDLPNLVLMTFVSTVGTPAGATVPATGFEEVSPRTTVIATIIAQAAPAHPQGRKAELLAALAAQDPDLTMLTVAATALFNAMRQHQIMDVAFSTHVSEGGGEGPDAGEGSTGGGGSAVVEGSAGGVGGAVGDGAELSPLVSVPCEFVLHPQGDSALEDLLDDGTLGRPELHAIAAEVRQDAALQRAFTRLFPYGVQPLDRHGLPLRTTTDQQGQYFLPVPSDTPGFVHCKPRPALTVATFVRARQAGETLTDQHVSPPGLFFAAFLVPLLPPQDVQAVANNFLTDIGDLRRATQGIVRVETVETPQGRLVADTDGDGVVCSLLEGRQAASIQYPPAAAAAYTATILFKALLIEARQPAMANYEALLADIFLRTTTTGSPRLDILPEDLQAGGVPGGRTTELAAQLNRCLRAGIEQTLGIPPPHMVRAGRLRVTVRDRQGTLLTQARTTVQGAMILYGSQCTRVAGQTVCSTDAQGMVTLVLQGARSLAVTPVLLLVESEDRLLTSQMPVDFVPPATKDIAVTVHPR